MKQGTLGVWQRQLLAQSEHSSGASICGPRPGLTRFCSRYIGCTSEEITRDTLRGQIGAYSEDCSSRLDDRACRRPVRKPLARVELDGGRLVWRLSRCSPTRSMRYTTLPLAPSSWARASFRRIACTAPSVRRIALAISLAVRPSRFRSRNRLTSVSLHDFLTLCIIYLPAVRRERSISRLNCLARWTPMILGLQLTFC